MKTLYLNFINRNNDNSLISNNCLSLFHLGCLTSWTCSTWTGSLSSTSEGSASAARAGARGFSPWRDCSRPWVWLPSRPPSTLRSCIWKWLIIEQCPLDWPWNRRRAAQWICTRCSGWSLAWQCRPGSWWRRRGRSAAPWCRSWPFLSGYLCSPWTRSSASGSPASLGSCPRRRCACSGRTSHSQRSIRSWRSKDCLGRPNYSHWKCTC